jgi:hypothetical protein
MEIKSQSSESNPAPEIEFPWVGRHIDKNGPIVFFHAQNKGIVIDGGTVNEGVNFPIGAYSEGWSMLKFKEFKGTVKIVSE